MQTLIVKVNGITRLRARADKIVFQDTPVGVWLRVQRYLDGKRKRKEQANDRSQ